MIAIFCAGAVAIGGAGYLIHSKKASHEAMVAGAICLSVALSVIGEFL